MPFDALTVIAAPAPARPAAPAAQAPADGASFADLLDRSREARHAMPDPARDAAADHHDGSVDDTRDAADAQTPAAAARRADRAPPPRRGDHAAPAKVDAPHGDATPPADKAGPDAPTTPADPTVPPWLAALHTPPAQAADAPAAGEAVGHAGPAATAALQGTATPALPAAPAGPDATRNAKADAAAALQAPPALRVEAAVSEDRAASVAAVAERPASPSTEPPQPLPTPTALAAPHRAAEPAPVAPPTAALATPVESPEFAAALGVQVSVFAREGVHRAELQLNPTEMGPVSVQIALDGTQARVHFGAEVAATRQAIEASLPELAAALRDAGFTLSGGGVSQQRSGRGDASGDAPDAGPRRARGVAGGAGENAVTPRGAARRVALGGLDLYA